MTRVVFPDVAALAIGIVNDGFAADGLTIPVGAVVPDVRPGEFVVLQRYGGTRRNIVMEAALLVVECWAAGPAEAVDLANTVRSYLFAAKGTVVDGVPIYGVDDVQGPSSTPDVLSDQPRFQFTVEMTVRGSKA